MDTIEEKVSQLLKDAGGEVESLENLGRRDFIRITDKDHTGDSYLEVFVAGPATMPATFQKSIRLDRLVKLAIFQSV